LIALVVSNTGETASWLDVVMEFCSCVSDVCLY